jgi:hypothetical protein
MPTLDDIKVWIEIDGEELEEYEMDQEPEELKERCISCFIPSEAGKEFVVRVEDGTGLSGEDDKV